MPSTRVFTVDPEKFSPDELDEPARILREGGLVAFPTETVYGLGVNAHKPEAVHRLVTLKDRPKEKPFSVHIADREDVDGVVDSVPAVARTLMDLYWPGPLTIIFPGNAGAGIGVRLPSHPVARELIRRAGVPVLAPSANRRGEPPASDGDSVMSIFDGEIDAVVAGGRVAIRQASTVVRVSDDDYEVLREGIITANMMRRAVRGQLILFVCTGNSCRSPMAEAMFRRMLAERLGVTDGELAQRGFRIGSAGVAAFSGGHASKHAIEVMEEMGLDIENHRSTAVTRTLVDEAEIIITLSPSHRWQLVQWEREIAPKVDVIKELGVSDPIGGSLDQYRECAREIERELRNTWLERILNL